MRFYFLLSMVLMATRVFGQCTITASADTVRACPGEMLALSASGGGNYTWSGSNNLSCTQCPNPTYTAQAGDVLVVSSNLSVNSLVVNGDFSQGNTGFTSNYIYNPTTIWNEGTYAVGPNPNTVHPNFGTWGDHTTGTGNYLLVNGSTNSNQILWQQTLSLPPGVQVDISLWLLTFVTPAGSMQISMNNNVLGAAFSSPSSAGVWQQRTRTFTVPPSGQCILRITTLSSSLAGNDFGLDDISLSYNCTGSDTVYVAVSPPPVLKARALKRIGCDSLCVQWSNQSGLSPSGHTFWWDYGDGSPLDTSYSASHCYSQPGIYYPVHYAKSTAGCENQLALAPVIIVPSPQLRADVSDTALCDNGCVQWTNRSGLDSNFFTFWWDYGDGSLPDTSFSGRHCYAQTGTFYPKMYVLRNDSFACTAQLDLARIRIENSPALSLLSAEGGEWNGSVYVLEPEVATAVFRWQVNGVNQLSVDWGDGQTETVIRSNSGAFEAMHDYQSPGPFKQCVYYQSSIGCTDTLCNEIDFWPSVEVPNVFSPNGDGSNDRYYPTFYSTERVEWAVFNRWGSEVFRTQDVTEAWDGTFRGSACAEGVYYVEVRMESPYGGQARTARSSLHLFR